MDDRILTLHAFVGYDEEGNEGIASTLSSDGMWFPMITGSLDKIGEMRDVAQEIANLSGRPVKLIRFAVRSDLEEIRPE